MNNYVISLIRTWVPIGVGAVAAWLLAHHLGLNATQEAGATAALTAALSAGYYAVVRAAEMKWPALGFLLGHTAKPLYIHSANKLP